MANEKNEKTEKSKDASEFFYVRALNDDMYVHADGKYYIMKAGNVLRVKKTKGNMASFQLDIKKERFELISGEEFKKLSKMKTPKEVTKDSGVADIDEFEAMISELG